MPTPPKFNVYRDGKMHVSKVMCATCIYRPIHEDRYDDVKAMAVKRDTGIPCHERLGRGAKRAICRGFYEHEQTGPLGLAKALGVIEFD